MYETILRSTNKSPENFSRIGIPRAKIAASSAALALASLSSPCEAAEPSDPIDDQLALQTLAVSKCQKEAVRTYRAGTLIIYPNKQRIRQKIYAASLSTKCLGYIDRTVAVKERSGTRGHLHDNTKWTQIYRGDGEFRRSVRQRTFRPYSQGEIVQQVVRITADPAIDVGTNPQKMKIYRSSS